MRALLGGDAAGVLPRLGQLRVHLRQLIVQLGQGRRLVLGDPLGQVGQVQPGQLRGHPLRERRS